MQISVGKRKVRIAVAKSRPHLAFHGSIANTIFDRLREKSIAQLQYRTDPGQRALFTM